MEFLKPYIEPFTGQIDPNYIKVAELFLPMNLLTRIKYAIEGKDNIPSSTLISIFEKEFQSEILSKIKKGLPMDTSNSNLEISSEEPVVFPFLEKILPDLKNKVSSFIEFFTITEVKKKMESEPYELIKQRLIKELTKNKCSDVAKCVAEAIKTSLKTQGGKTRKRKKKSLHRKRRKTRKY